jgi:thymidylate synthase
MDTKEMPVLFACDQPEPKGTWEIRHSLDIWSYDVFLFDDQGKHAELPNYVYKGRNSVSLEFSVPTSGKLELREVDKSKLRIRMPEPKDEIQGLPKEFVEQVAKIKEDLDNGTETLTPYVRKTIIDDFNAVESACADTGFRTFMEVAETYCPDFQHQQLFNYIEQAGSKSSDRTGTGTTKIVANMMHFGNVNFWFPIIESREVSYDFILDELIWLKNGIMNTKLLTTRIWDSWAKSDGSLGPVYGKQWRRWSDTKYLFTGDPDAKERYDFLISQGYVQRGSYEAGDTGYDELVMYKEYDQLQNMVNKLRTNPDDRRILCSSWNVGDIMDMALPPCHLYFQVVSDSDSEARKHDLDVHEELYGERPARVLDMVYLMRSSDSPIGKPYNDPSYATLLIALARLTGHAVGSLSAFTVDTHVYNNQWEAVNKQRLQFNEMYEDLAMGRRISRPVLKTSIDQNTNLDDIDASMFKLMDYKPMPVVRFPKAAV